jgi:hypothetical protein
MAVIPARRGASVCHFLPSFSGEALGRLVRIAVRVAVVLFARFVTTGQAECQVKTSADFENIL